jgi:hypothetical protein
MANDGTYERIVARVFDPEVIQKMKLIPKGYKSMIIESALSAYFKSKVGEDLYLQLMRHVNVKPTVKKTPDSKNRGVMNRLTGDF